jgi:hypothetical protein
MRKKTVLISPIRDLSIVPRMEIYAIADELEAEGWEVYCPLWDTEQCEDPDGLWICSDNRAAIRLANAVHVIWDGESQGVLFDLGMAFALGKPLYIIEIPEKTDGKSFQNMMYKWSEITPGLDDV